MSNFRTKNQRRPGVIQGYTGFTLSEVLITLAIIGVVAAMIIPPLINNYQKTQYVTQLKKAYSEFNQALQQISIDNNCSNDIACSGLFKTGSTSTTIGNSLIPYFKLIKNCQTLSNSCFSQNMSQYYDGRNKGNYLSGYSFILANGTSILLTWIYGNDCQNDYSTHSTNSMVQTCGAVFFDINGPDKEPNSRGRDIFGFYITNGTGASLYPMGGIDDNRGIAVGTNSWWRNPINNTSRYCYSGNPDGYFCAGRVLEEGWQMNY